MIVQTFPAKSEDGKDALEPLSRLEEKFHIRSGKKRSDHRLLKEYTISHIIISKGYTKIMYITFPKKHFRVLGQAQCEIK